MLFIFDAVQIKGMINLREQEQIWEDFVFFKRFQAPRRWTMEEACSMLGKHKTGELFIGQMLGPTSERNTSAETIKVRMVISVNFGHKWSFTRS